MLTLSFDTSLDKTYIVLGEDSEILSSIEIHSDEKNYHSAYLISTIAEVLKKHNKTPKDIEKIGVNIGPGSFTGIRACTTVARMLAQQLNLKAIGVSSLEILSKTLGRNDLVALDARKNKAYVYDGEILGAVELEDVDKLIANRRLITDNSLLERFSQYSPEVVSYQQKEFQLGEILAKIAIEKLHKGEDSDWRKVKPLYIQPPPVFGR